MTVKHAIASAFVFGHLPSGWQFHDQMVTSNRVEWGQSKWGTRTCAPHRSLENHPITTVTGSGSASYRIRPSQ